MEQYDPYHTNDDDQEDQDDASTLESKSLVDGEESGYPLIALPRIVTAGDELESLCRAEMSGGNDPEGSSATSLGFPPTCLPIVRLLGGNHCCVDCGDEEASNLNYGSIGYGTILCKECAHRHVTMTSEESIIKSLKDDYWNLRNTLTILEGSNSGMLDFVKHKPRWRPAKGNKTSELESEDVLAFKQIYLSKAASTYRKALAKRVDDAFYRSITTMREEDAAREDRAALAAASMGGTPCPFRRIFERNGVPPDEIPELFRSKHDDEVMANTAISGRRKGRGARGSQSSAAVPLTRHDAASVATIKERISRRRFSLSGSIAPSASVSASFASHPNQRSVGGSFTAQGSSRPVQGYARKGSDYAGLVGEVGDASILEQDDRTQYTTGDGSYRTMANQHRWSQEGGWQQQGGWSQAGDQDDRTMATFSSRTNAQPLGRYRRNEAN